jgi:hypothetical protein
MQSVEPTFSFLKNKAKAMAITVAMAMANARAHVLMEAPGHTKAMLNFEWSMLNWIHVGFYFGTLIFRSNI